MKKNLLTVFAVVLCMAFVLTGCATVGDVLVNGKKVYYDDIQYYYGQVAHIGDYLYYGNSYTNSTDEGFNYKSSAKTGYMARLDISKDLVYSDEADKDGYVNPSPKGVEKVNKKLAGYQNQDMFALGDYLYFTSANTHKTKELKNDYSRVSLFRMKFNGDKVEEIETFRYDEKSVITVQKGSDNNYYYLAFVPNGEESHNLYSIKIGKKMGKTVLIQENVLSVAMCDKDSTKRNVVFTTKSDEKDYDITLVKYVDFATGEIVDCARPKNGTVATMLGRVGDTVFYSYKDRSTKVYYKDLVNDDNVYSSGNWFYDAESITLLGKRNDQYIFIATSKSVMMKTLTDKITDIGAPLLKSEDYTDILFMENGYIYYSSATQIARVNMEREKETLVAMTDIMSGQCGYDGEYIYFYAKLETEKAEGETEDADKVDSNYYLFRADKNFETTGEKPQLLSKVNKQ